MKAPRAYPLKFQIGARTLFVVDRRLIHLPCSLKAVMAGEMPALPPLGNADGYAFTSLPETLTGRSRGYGLLVHVRQTYTRYFADFADGFESYMAHFSAKSRATLRRKLKRFAEASGGVIDIRSYRTPAEIADFAEIAGPLSRRSYQHRLLDAGLPAGESAQREMAELAAADRVRAFLLFRQARAIAYLYLPIADETLIYAYLGYDPDEADLSPGTVLQLEAIRLLAAEGRYGRIDFTEGGGQHKRLFATGGVACADVLLLRPTLGNRLLIGALGGFDGLVATAKRLSAARGFGWLKKLRR